MRVRQLYWRTLLLLRPAIVSSLLSSLWLATLFQAYGISRFAIDCFANGFRPCVYGAWTMLVGTPLSRDFSRAFSRLLSRILATTVARSRDCSRETTNCRERIRRSTLVFVQGGRKTVRRPSCCARNKAASPEIIVLGNNLLISYIFY